MNYKSSQTTALPCLIVGVGVSVCVCGGEGGEGKLHFWTKIIISIRFLSGHNTQIGNT